MTRTRVGSALVLLILLLGLAWWLRGSTPETPSPTQEPTAAATRAKPVPRFDLGDLQPLPEDTDTEPATPEQEALQAVFPDRITIRCSAGSLVAEGQLISFAPLTRYDPMASALHLADGELVGFVDHPFGQGFVMNGMTTVAELEWWDAHPGREGGCALDPVRKVTISGMVRTPDGEPAHDAYVRGCGTGDVVQATGGSFKIQVPRARACRLVAFSSTDGYRNGPPVEVEAADALTGIELEIPSEGASFEEQRAEIGRMADQLLAMEDAMAAIPNAFEEALEGGELSSDAREMVEAWASAEAERSTQRRRMLEALLDEDLEAYEADQLGVAMP